MNLEVQRTHQSKHDPLLVLVRDESEGGCVSGEHCIRRNQGNERLFGTRDDMRLE